VPNKIEIRVVENRIPELLIHVRVRKKYMLEDTAKELEDDAKSRLSPGHFGYETGKARESIKGDVHGDEAILQGGGDEAPYFPYNEFGTRYRAAAPALVPAYLAHKNKFIQTTAELVAGFK
jgi:HK97 gp10 family phage protein